MLKSSIRPASPLQSGVCSSGQSNLWHFSHWHSVLLAGWMSFLQLLCCELAICFLFCLSVPKLPSICMHNVSSPFKNFLKFSLKFESLNSHRSGHRGLCLFIIYYLDLATEDFKCVFLIMGLSNCAEGLRGSNLVEGGQGHLSPRSILADLCFT